MATVDPVAKTRFWHSCRSAIEDSAIQGFRMSDVTFSVGRTVFDTESATDNDLAAATFVILPFTTQKNGVRGEKIGHGATGDPLLCPKDILPPLDRR